MKLYQDIAWLRKRYVVDGKTTEEMAAEAGCSHMTIQRYLEKHNLIKNQRRWVK
jgi:DNA-binding transcriptional regulator LsrR (DeoR family)